MSGFGSVWKNHILHERICYFHWLLFMFTSVNVVITVRSGEPSPLFTEIRSVLQQLWDQQLRKFAQCDVSESLKDSVILNLAHVIKKVSPREAEPVFA